MQVTHQRLYTINLHKEQRTYPVLDSSPLFLYIQKIADVAKRCFSCLKLLWDKVNCKKTLPPPPPLVLIDESLKAPKISVKEDPKTFFYRHFYKLLDHLLGEVPNLKEESLRKVCSKLIPISKESLSEEVVEPDRSLEITVEDLLEETENYRDFNHLVRWAIENDKELALSKIKMLKDLVTHIEDDKKRNLILSDLCACYGCLGEFEKAFELLEYMNGYAVGKLAVYAIDADQMDRAEEALDALIKLMHKNKKSVGIFTPPNILDWMAERYAKNGDFDSALDTFRRTLPRKDSAGAILKIAYHMTKANQNIFDKLTEDEKAFFKDVLEMYIRLAKLDLVNEKILKRGLSDTFIEDLGTKILNRLCHKESQQKFQAVFSHWNEADFSLKMEINKFILIDLLDSILDKNNELLNKLHQDTPDAFEGLAGIIAEHVEKYIKQESEESFVNRFHERYLEFIALNGPIVALPTILPMMNEIEDKAKLLDIFVKIHGNLDQFDKR